MPDFGPHASFIIAAYAVTALAVGALTCFILAADRKQQRTLAELDARGIRRRSAAPETAPSPVLTTKNAPRPKPAQPRTRKKKAS
jgi:heme exporter protein D